ncbi:MAG: hypothetical protein WCO71_02115, partial [Pseudomonadota bacterium]
MGLVNFWPRDAVGTDEGFGGEFDLEVDFDLDPCRVKMWVVRFFLIRKINLNSASLLFPL